MGGIAINTTTAFVRAVAVSTSFVLCGIALAHEETKCDRQVIAMLLSDDNTWVALMHEDVCSDGHFVTTLTDTVQLSRRDSVESIQLAPYQDKVKHENDVLTIDASPGGRPTMLWPSNGRLQITVPNRSLVGLHKGSYSGIEVVLKFQPDDPSDREKWLRSLGVPAKWYPSM